MPDRAACEGIRSCWGTVLSLFDGVNVKLSWPSDAISHFRKSTRDREERTRWNISRTWCKTLERSLTRENRGRFLSRSSAILLERYEDHVESVRVWLWAGAKLTNGEEETVARDPTQRFVMWRVFTTHWVMLQNYNSSRWNVVYMQVCSPFRCCPVFAFPFRICAVLFCVSCGREPRVFYCLQAALS